VGASEGLFVASMSVRHTVGITSGARSHRSARRVAALAPRVHRQQVALHFLMVARHENLGHAAWRIMTRWRAGQCHACSRRRSRLRPSADRWTRSCDSDWCFRSQLSGAEMDRYGSMGWGRQRCAKSAESRRSDRLTSSSNGSVGCGCIGFSAGGGGQAPLQAAGSYLCHCVLHNCGARATLQLVPNGQYKS
jgi:hypothetical protein